MAFEERLAAESWEAGGAGVEMGTRNYRLNPGVILGSSLGTFGRVRDTGLD